MRITLLIHAAMTSLPGWYGKLPSVGDFVSRRMSPDALDRWDAWLATGLSTWQSQDPQGWLAQYLASPCWRFVAMPRALGEAEGARAGVLMPSLDRVGRYFPFTLLQPISRLPGSRVELQDLLAWLHRLDDLAVDALNEDWPVDRLEEALVQSASAAPSWIDSAAPAAAAVIDGAIAQQAWHTLDQGTDLVEALAAGVGAVWQRSVQGQVWWWCTDAQGHHHLKVTQGLPVGPSFVELMTPPTATTGAPWP